MFQTMSEKRHRGAMNHLGIAVFAGLPPPPVVREFLFVCLFVCKPPHRVDRRAQWMATGNFSVLALSILVPFFLFRPQRFGGLGDSENSAIWGQLRFVDSSDARAAAEVWQHHDVRASAIWQRWRRKFSVAGVAKSPRRPTR